jgi:hypothetical protein
VVGDFSLHHVSVSASAKSDKFDIPPFGSAPAFSYICIRGPFSTLALGLNHSRGDDMTNPNAENPQKGTDKSHDDQQSQGDKNRSGSGQQQQGHREGTGQQQGQREGTGQQQGGQQQGGQREGTGHQQGGQRDNDTSRKEGNR